MTPVLPVEDGTEDRDTCPLCGGDWLNCGCDAEDADAAYVEPEGGNQ